MKKHFRSYHIVDNKVNTTLIYSRRMRKRGERDKGGIVDELQS